MQLTRINGKYELWLPDHRAAREQWDIANGGWEVERTEELLKVLKPSDILFELGVEEGDLTALLVKESGCSVVMFEPNVRVWPCIKMIWDENKLPKPLDFYPGFASDKTIEHTKQILSIDEIDVSQMISDHGFKQLYENYPDVPQITLDDYCAQTGVYPTVINVDCEGCEALIMRGAEKTLRDKKPVIFMSVHAEFMYESYRNEGKWKEKYGERQFVVHMLEFMLSCGYKYDCIKYDLHELHMKFWAL